MSGRSFREERSRYHQALMKLGGDVADKVLPEVFARGAERMARFQREEDDRCSIRPSGRQD